MSENTKIEWADHTFNPWYGCTKVSPGCDHCYAEARMDTRLHRVQWGAGQPRVRSKTWRDPEKWNKQHAEFYAQHGRRQRVFCASLADVFDNEVPPEWRAELFNLIEFTPNLDWLLLTKRIGNATAMMHGTLLDRANGWTPPDNLWLGTSIVNQEEADRDIPKLLATPAAKRFLSMEPLLGAVNLSVHFFGRCPEHDFPGGFCLDRKHPGVQHIDWVIVGGESGPGARPMHPDWARSLRDQCFNADVPFLFKQWGEFLPSTANEHDPTLPDVTDSRLYWSDGSKWDRFDGQRAGVDLVARVGKKAAGRVLDGLEHNGFPEASC